jgi:hypothetical protein
VLSSGQATLVCVTGATASPEADSGTLTTLRVAVLDAAGGEVSSASLADSYMLRPLSELPTLTGWPYPYPYLYPTPTRTLPVPYPYPSHTPTGLDRTQGSAAGGLQICLSGTGLEPSSEVPTATVGEATCALNASASTLTRLCCITSPAASAASVAVAVLVPSLGYAVSRSSMPSFAYLNAQTAHLLLPPSSYAGSTVTLITDRLDSVPEVWLGDATCSSVQLENTANGRSNVRSSIIKP